MSLFPAALWLVCDFTISRSNLLVCFVFIKSKAMPAQIGSNMHFTPGLYKEIISLDFGVTWWCIRWRINDRLPSTAILTILALPKYMS